ncbi:MAG: hypothetical protein Kow001_10330 [Acidobacteriota bacterium]
MRVHSGIKTAGHLCWWIVLLAMILPAMGTPADQAQSRYIVYYFHTTGRCATCVRIEKLAQAVVQNEFPQLTAAGKLQFCSVDVQDPVHRHFIRDYRLVTKSVVLVEEQEGRPVRWKNLSRIWELVWYQDRYQNYVRAELAAFMEGR